MKQCLILGGVSGVGKTTLRKALMGDNPSTPVIDALSIYQDTPELTWKDRFAIMIERLDEALEHNDIVVVEGYFLPDSPTLALLLQTLEQLDVVPQYVFLWTTMEEIERRLKAIEDERGRLELARKTWKPLPLRDTPVRAFRRRG